MSLAALAAQLSSWQSAEGAFASTVTLNDRQEPDWNGFVTALVLRELRRFPADPAIERVRSQAVRFLESCASPTGSGAFSFWPHRHRPTWASQVLADTDDTAVMSLELARHGQLKRQDLLKTICKVLVTQRIPADGVPGPAWIVPGAFLTWITTDRQRPNVVDCCVNANVLALMAYANATHLPGYEEACRLIEAGLEWAGESFWRLRLLTPFYPNPQELYYAVDHAVACGVDRLEDSLQRLSSLVANVPLVDETPICSSAYHAIVWTCPALVQIRRYDHVRQ